MQKLRKGEEKGNANDKPISKIWKEEKGKEI
jgi:hypothetical protein